MFSERYPNRRERISAQRKKGYLCLVLHAHLPYVRHPEHEHFLEENWLYEALTETYVPLLDMFSRLLNDRIDFRITFSLSPPLLEMFNDDLLVERYRRHLERLIELSEREVWRTRRDIRLRPVVKMYLNKFRRIQHLFEKVYNKKLISAFRQLQDTGKIEIITTAGTHAYLPNLSMFPRAVKTQIKIGVWHYLKNFGRPPAGFWLPECGYVPGYDLFMKENNLMFFFVDTHGIIRDGTPPPHGVYSPVDCPSGISAFGRDVQTSRQVWSSIWGYPGDAHYRDFYRDAGYDLDNEGIQAFLRPYGARTYTGLKYFRITGMTDRKEPYDILRAVEKTDEHAMDFVLKREMQVNLLYDRLKIPPIVSAMYDAELFGHWWFEGPEWLESVLRHVHYGQRNFTTVTPSEYLCLHYHDPAVRQYCQPSMSSWGDKGYSEVWLNETNDFVCRHILKATERMLLLADSFQRAEGMVQRALNQAAREILLAQHSDWAFIMRNQTVTEYAERRFQEHISRFTSLYQAINSGSVPEKWLAELEEKDKIFRDLDYTFFRDEQQEALNYESRLSKG